MLNFLEIDAKWVLQPFRNSRKTFKKEAFKYTKLRLSSEFRLRNILNNSHLWVVLEIITLLAFVVEGREGGGQFRWQKANDNFSWGSPLSLWCIFCVANFYTMVPQVPHHASPNVRYVQRVKSTSTIALNNTPPMMSKARVTHVHTERGMQNSTHKPCLRKRCCTLLILSFFEKVCAFYIMKWLLNCS